MTLQSKIGVAALGLLPLGGVILWLALRSPTTSASRKDNNEKVKESRAITGDTAFAGWGPLADVAKRMGPDTAFQKFLAGLKEHNPKGFAWNWNIRSITTPTGNPTADILFTVTGKGKLYSELVVKPSFDDTLYASVLFTGAVAVDQQLMLEHRNKRVLQTGLAMSMTDAEIRRLRGLLRVLPVSAINYPASVTEKRIWSFVDQLPARVRRDFKAAWRYKDGGLDAIRAKVQTDGEAPAVGFPLSEKRIANVIFAPVEAMTFYGGPSYNVKYGKVGPWWTIALWPREDQGFTQEKGSKTGEITMLPWPRLTLKEVDAIVAALEKKRGSGEAAE